MEPDLLAITELGESDQREQLQALLAALDGGDPRVVLRLMGVEISDDAEIPAELLAQLTGDPELQEHIEQLRAQLAGSRSRETSDTRTSATRFPNHIACAYDAVGL